MLVLHCTYSSVRLLVYCLQVILSELCHAFWRPCVCLMAVVLREAAVTEHALLLLHGAADDDPDREDEDRQGHTQRWVVILELAATVCTVGAAMIMMGNVRKMQNRVGDAVNHCCNNLNV